MLIVDEAALISPRFCSVENSEQLCPEWLINQESGIPTLAWLRSAQPFEEFGLSVQEHQGLRSPVRRDDLR